MSGFKFYARVLWPNVLLALLFVSGLGLIIHSTHSRMAESARMRESAPCINFNETPIQEVPARCFAYFAEHK